MRKEDEYAIAQAKTEYRDAYNAGDAARLLAVFATQFTDCSEGEPSFYGDEAPRALRLRTQELFLCNQVEFGVIIIQIMVMGDLAYDRGWHKVRLTDKNTGEVREEKYRYFETWKKEDGAWKIGYIITNKELPPRMLPDMNERLEGARLSTAP